MKVRVIDWGLRYTTYDEWLINNDCSQYLKNYRQEESLIDHFDYLGDEWYALDKSNKELDMSNITYEVLKQNVHGGSNGDIMLLLIQEPISNKVYLIEKRGTEEVK